jgi:hypothetical protein
MNNIQMVRTNTLHKLTRLAVIVLFAAILSAVPFYAAFAQTAPSLGTAANFAVLGGTNVTCTAPGSIIGDVGVSPGSAVPFTNTGCTIVGRMPPATNAAAFLAQGALLSAYNSLVGQACTQTISTAAFTGNVPALGPLAPGVYCFPAGVTFTDTTLTLDGSTNPNGIWIFKVGAALSGNGFQVVMTNGAQPCNVYWAVGADVTLTTSTLPPLFLGNILAGAPTAAGGSITITGGSVVGRVLANTAVTMTGTSVVGCGSVVPPIPPDLCKDVCKGCRDNDKDDDGDNDHGEKHGKKDGEKHGEKHGNDRHHED